MKYSIDALRYANSIIEKRRADALKQFEKNKLAAYKKIPQLLTIDDELSSSGLLISKSVVANKGDVSKLIQEIRTKNNNLISKKQQLLEENEFPSDFLSIPYRCKKCNDTGYINAMPCDCLKEILNEYSIQESIKKSQETPYCFQNFNLNLYPETYNNAPCREIMSQVFGLCKEYCDDFSVKSPNLLLLGATGTGKTHLSLAIFKDVAEKGFNCVYMSAPDLFTTLEKERFNQQIGAENMNSITSCELLVIDDLGSEFITTFTVSALYNIINTRLLNELPTIISSNLTFKEITEKYHERITSRLFGCYERLQFCGEDIRIKKKLNY